MNRPAPRTIAASAAAPCVMVLVAATFLDLGPAWWAWSPLSRSAAAGTTLALNTLLLLAACAVAAPAAGPGILYVTVFAAASMVGLTTVAGPTQAASLLAGHVVLAASGCMVLTAGALARRVWRTPLDAAGVSCCLAGLLVTAILALGPAVPAVPTWLVNLLLRVNPVVAVTAAAGIDLLRTSAIYHLSPVPHWMFDYPSWLSSAVTYAAAAAAFTGINRLGRATGSHG